MAAAAGVAALMLSGCANSGGSSGGGEESGGAKNQLPAQDSIEVPQDAAKAAGDGKGKCESGTSIAYVGALTGPNAQLGINIVNGVQTALNEHNDANPDCKIELKKFDTEGDPAKATGPSAQAVKEDKIIGVVGLPFSGESKATGKIFEDAGLVHITPAATNPELTQNGWKTFFRGLGNDTVQGPALAKLTEKVGSSKVCLVQDDSDYGMGLAKQVKSALGDKLACEDKVTTGQKDFGPTAQKVTDAKADAVIYSGYYAEGAPFDNQLSNQGFEGVFIGPDGVKDTEFVKQAGSAASNAYYTCACVPGDLIKDFSDAYEKVSNGTAPGTYSVEGYDTATVLMAGIDSGIKDRKKLEEWVKDYDKPGYGKTYKWDDKGELTDKTVYGYKTDGDKIVSVGKID
ncbi:branched-chain amino acid ABC transporter substrate-binding protein [Brevibacterium rongguiense]|uniref:branched-chain amino acid ABC transporter substrate-binding protein n=1 Tax=Brevibacterium rongguiense TaxID=2695267 RepID=UPI001F17B08D|nr:branched-chain amino acid ABC transporter substrate-binding protein [Brevibacterium rongguiense]